MRLHRRDLQHDQIVGLGQRLAEVLHLLLGVHDLAAVMQELRVVDFADQTVQLYVAERIGEYVQIQPFSGLEAAILTL